ncbi:MAG: nucleoside triphosphate pyrophosphohydrolase [Candidatus Latescibacterota bacterium]|nr:MAG: nucleoside triphosphate pyrophosphohydrolase [Candidatus Latescibacterota bacterium]
MKTHNLQKLFDLIGTLRGDAGCPWDRAQTLDGILSDLVEETYELQWAQAQGSHNELLEELGDVLFVLVFAIALVREIDPSVTVDGLATKVHAKIVRRHPHVFGDAVARNESESLAHWDRIKAKEKHTDVSPFDRLAGNLPPMRMADKIQRLAARAGFDWPNTTGIFQKIEEEIREVKDVTARLPARPPGDDSGVDTDTDTDSGAASRLEEEIGDLFFSVINLSRFLNIDGEAALSQANAKFVKRYRAIEALAKADGHRLEDLTLEEMDVYWERTKKTER